MKCNCGSYITQQARIVAKMYKVEIHHCIYCLSEKLEVPYEELLDRYMGIYECRECTKNKKKVELRRKLLGID